MNLLIACFAQPASPKPKDFQFTMIESSIFSHGSSKYLAFFTDEWIKQLINCSWLMFLCSTNQLINVSFQLYTKVSLISRILSWLCDERAFQPACQSIALIDSPVCLSDSSRHYFISAGRCAAFTAFTLWANSVHFLVRTKCLCHAFF